MDYVIEQVISEVRKRHKRSLWGAINSFFNKESSEDETSKEVKSEDGESEGTPKIIRPATRHDQEVIQPDVFSPLAPNSDPRINYHYSFKTM